MRRKKQAIITIFLILIAGVIFFVVQNDSTLHLRINDNLITEEEYLDAMNQSIYETTQYFFEKYDARVDDEFWEKDFEGEIPYKVLADRTIHYLKYLKSTYEIAVEKEYVADAKYQSFLKRFEEENAKRAEKVKNGEPVYGLSEFSQKLFREYELDTFQKLYCEDAENEGMEISDSERQAFYDTNKETLFSMDDDIILDYIKINYESDQLSDADVSQFKDKLTRIFKQIDSQHTLAALVQDDLELQNYMIHEEVTSAEYGVKGKYMEDILYYAMELKQGETTNVIDENGSLYFIQCVKRVNHDYQPIEEVKYNIEKALREEHYNQIVAKRAENARIEGDMNKIYFFTKKHIKTK